MFIRIPGSDFGKIKNILIGLTKMTSLVPEIKSHTFKSKISTQKQLLIKYFSDLSTPGGSNLFGILYQWNYSLLQNVDSLIWNSEEVRPFQRPLMKKVFSYDLVLGRNLGFEGVAHHF